jgi:glycosyltransferase involved in cell wall biosynthesis
MPAMMRQRRILVLSPFPPRPEATHGGAHVIGRLVETLAEEHYVGVLFLRAREEPGLGAGLGRRLALVEEVRRPDRQSGPGRRLAGLAHAARGLAAGRPAWASDWWVRAFAARAGQVAAAWRPDVVQAEFHVMGQYLPGLRGYGALVLVEHEPGAAAARDRAATARGPERVARRVDAGAWRRYERRVLACADAVVAFTERDQTELEALAGGVPVARIPFGADLPAEPLDALGTDPPRIVFVGNLNHPPNAQAAVDLVHRIAPAVRRQRPDVVIEIVGEAPRALARRLRVPGVVVAGVVPEVGPHLDRAAVVAVPARLGGGMRVKVVQTLAAGKALVATARAVEGLDLVPGRHALIAETDDEFADAITGLLNDPERRRALGMAARAWAGVHLRWEDVRASYDELYASLEGSARC